MEASLDQQNEVKGRNSGIQGEIGEPTHSDSNRVKHRKRACKSYVT